MLIEHSSGYLLSVTTAYPDGTFTAAARHPERLKKTAFHFNAPTADIALQQVMAWCDAQESLLHEAGGAEVTPAIVEVVAPGADDGASAEIADHPGGGLESEVLDVGCVQVDPLKVDALALSGAEEHDLDPGELPLEIHHDAIQLDQPLSGPDVGIDLDAGGPAEQD